MSYPDYNLYAAMRESGDDLPPFVTLTELAEALRPADREARSFRSQLKRLLAQMNIPAPLGHRTTYFTFDLKARAPALVEAWVKKRAQRAANTDPQEAADDKADRQAARIYSQNGKIE